MSEKLTESITFKCTYEEKKEFEAIARAEKTDVSKLSRICMNEKISTVREYLDSLRSFMCLTTDTVDTSFELQAPPRFIDVTPKPQAQKKPICANNWTFLPFTPKSKQGWNPMTNLTRRVGAVKI